MFEILQKISKEDCKKFIILAYFQRKFQSPALNYRVFGQKHNWFGKFEKILKIFDENSIENGIFISLREGCC